MKTVHKNITWQSAQFFSVDIWWYIHCWLCYQGLENKWKDRRLVMFNGTV